MSHRRIALLFPFLVLGLLGLERITAFLLGQRPSSAWLWQLSFGLRALFRNWSNWFSDITGQSLAVQLTVLAAAAVALVVLGRSRQGIAAAFLLNHAALLFVVALTVLSVNATTASAGNTFPFGENHLALWDAGMTRLGIAAALGGLISCGYCHYLFVTHATRRSTPLKVALRTLAHDFDRRRI